MIALFAVETKKALFQNRVLSVPKRERKADVLMAIADSRDAVLVPTIGP